MYKIEATLTGKSPLRHNKFIINKGGTSKKKSEQELISEAMERSYYDKDKGFYIPKHALKRVICNGGKKVKIGRGSASIVLFAIMIMDEDRYYIGSHDYKIYEEPVRIPPKTGARIMKMFVINPEWRIKFSANVLDDVVPADAIKESLQFGGLYNGLLDGRPEYGRFELTEFKKMML